MLERLVRKSLAMIGLQEVSDDDVLRVIQSFKLQRLPAHYNFALISIFPIIQMIVKKLSEENIDWSEIEFEEQGIDKTF